MKNSMRLILIMIILCLIFAITACGKNNEEDSNVQIAETDMTNEILENEGNKHESYEKELGNGNENEAEVSPIYNSTYKLFYGEWEITKVIGYDFHLGKSFPEADEMIGVRINYSKEEINTKSINIDKFDYSYTINPNITDLCYFNNTLTNEQLGIKGEYYVFVHVETYIPEVNLGINFVGDEFFIVDDKTLILVKNNVFFLAERLSYIDDTEDIDYSHW